MIEKESFPTIEEIKDILPKRLKLLREKSGLTLREAAEIIDKSPSQLSFWERGINPPTCIDLFKLCVLYNAGLSDVFLKIDKNVKPSIQELELISKYRSADDDVKATIRKILDYTQNKEKQC